jgi:hypothetical protein
MSLAALTLTCDICGGRLSVSDGSHILKVYVPGPMLEPDELIGAIEATETPAADDPELGRYKFMAIVYFGNAKAPGNLNALTGRMLVERGAKLLFYHHKCRNMPLPAHIIGG